MPRFKVIFKVPSEVIVWLDAADEDSAAEAAWEHANDLTQSSAMETHRGDVVVDVNVNLDGIGDDSVTGVNP